MHSRSTALFVLFAMVLAALVAPGCSNVEEATDSSVDEALCSADDANVYLTAKPDAPVTLFADQAHRQAQGTLAAGALVVRKHTVETSPNAPYSFVQVESGPLAGTSGWVDAKLLALRTPSGGACTNGFDFEQKANAFERGQSIPEEPIGAEVFKDTLQCVVGLGQGTGKEAQGFVEGFASLANGAFDLANEIVKRDEFILLYAFGSKKAKEKLVAIGIADEQRVAGAVGIVTHAIPVIHRMLASEWVYYQTLDSSHQANYICQLVGRLAFEVVTWIATADLAQLADISRLARIEAANSELSAVANIPGRIGRSQVIDIGHDFAASKKGAYWNRLQANLDRLPEETDLATQMRLIREVSDDINVPYLAKNAGKKVNVELGRGNCGNAAVSTMLSLASGHLVCTLPYLPTDANTYASWDAFAQSFKDLGVYGRESKWIGAEAMEAYLDNWLAEGQMAWLGQQNGEAAHATFVVKLEGKLYNVNNQGWDQGLGLGADKLQPIHDWFTFFDSHFDGANYMTVITKLKIGQNP